MNLLHLTFLLVEPENSALAVSTRRITFKRPPNPWDLAETMMIILHLFFYHRDLWKLSDQLNDGKTVFSGTGMPDMSNSARLAIRPKPKLTQISESTIDAKSVELPQKDVDSSFFLVTVSFSLDEETVHKYAAIPTQRQPSM